METRTATIQCPVTARTRRYKYTLTEEVADILYGASSRKHHFTQVDPIFTDDPPPRPTQTLPLVDRDDDRVRLLDKAANRGSAPGQTGHTWILLKWVWKADPDRPSKLDIGLPESNGVTTPRPWKEAIVCVIHPN